MVEIQGVWGKVRLRLLGGGKSWGSGGKWEVLGFAKFCLCIIVEGGVPVWFSHVAGQLGMERLGVGRVGCEGFWGSGGGASLLGLVIVTWRGSGLFVVHCTVFIGLSGLAVSLWKKLGEVVGVWVPS